MRSLRLALLLLASASLSTLLNAETPKLYSLPLQTIEEQETTLQPYAGKVLLIVNVASQCGYTPQYEGLEALHQKFKGRGLAVLGFPSNDFGEQEPGSNAEIKTFCTSRYNVSFPMFAKLHVKGAGQHPLFGELTGPQSAAPGPVQWNFGKFLVGRDGKVLARYDSDTEPDSPTLTQAIEQALAAK